ncbi:MAG TPA: hypothetical protein VMV56_09820 [Williamwhitmania sp.]|nr:hypothetical protein [Williamwhitmania sp.]
MAEGSRNPLIQKNLRENELLFETLKKVYKKSLDRDWTKVADENTTTPGPNTKQLKNENNNMLSEKSEVELKKNSSKEGCLVDFVETTIAILCVCVVAYFRWGLDMHSLAIMVALGLPILYFIYGALVARKDWYEPKPTGFLVLLVGILVSLCHRDDSIPVSEEWKLLIAYFVWLALCGFGIWLLGQLLAFLLNWISPRYKKHVKKKSEHILYKTTYRMHGRERDEDIETFRRLWEKYYIRRNDTWPYDY